MATYKVFIDTDGNELKTYENDKGLCFLTCGDLTNENHQFIGHICLDLQDLSELILELQFIKKSMEENE